MMTKALDAVGQEVRVGDTVAYLSQYGKSLSVRLRTVLELLPPHAEQAMFAPKVGRPPIYWRAHLTPLSTVSKPGAVKLRNCIKVPVPVDHPRGTDLPGRPLATSE